MSFKDQGQATNAVVTGRADAMLADSPVVAYAIKQSGGKLEALGDIYEAAPYGYVVPKAETEFAEAIVQALEEIEADGGTRPRWPSGASSRARSTTSQSTRRDHHHPSSGGLATPTGPA